MLQSLTPNLATPLPFGVQPAEYARRLAAYRAALNDAFHTEYREIFLITAAICLLGTLPALALGSRQQIDRESEGVATADGPPAH
jgi:MFS transporter, DHA2 family, triacylglyceride efflux pump